jgi:Bacterial regulatory proteins, gntR family
VCGHDRQGCARSAVGPARGDPAVPDRLGRDHQPAARERALHQEFGLAPVTIRKAVRQLRDEGLVRTASDWGTYVVKKNDDAGAKQDG